MRAFLIFKPGPALILLLAACSANPVCSQTDQAAPLFTIIKADPAIVDVTNGQAGTEIELKITDDVSGLSSGSILVELEHTSFKWFFNNGSLVQGLPTNGTYRVPIVFEPGSPPGERRIGAIVFDGAGRSRSGYSDTVNITIVNNGQVDLEPPALHNLTLTPQVLDLSNGPGEVFLEIDVSDDVSGIDWIEGDLMPPIKNFSPDSRKFIWFGPTQGNERKTLTATYPLGEWSPAGEWRVEFEEITDRADRVSPYSFGAQALYTDFQATVTVINPNEDLAPPVLESLSFDRTTVDTTYGEVLLPYTVGFSDAVSGIYSVSVQLHPPSGGRYIYAYRRDTEGFATGDANAGSISGNFKVPPFIQIGAWGVSVRIWDKAGHAITYGHGSSNPLPPGSPSFIVVENAAGVDEEDMIITDVVVTPAAVDITDGSRFADIFISFADNLSGLNRMSLRVDSPDGEFKEFLSINTQDLVSGTLTEGTVRTTIQIPQFGEPGLWTFATFSTTDAAGNYDSRNSRPVFIGDLPNGIQVINNGPRDLEPPELISLALPKTTVDITNGDVRLPIQVTASDDVSGIDRLVIYYKHPETGDTINFFPRSGNAVFRDGNTLTMEDTGLVRQFSGPGDYLLDQMTIHDNIGRRTQFRADRDPGFPDGLPGEITVINDGPVDREPPQITDIRLSRTTVDVTNGPQFISAEIDFSDDETGLQDIEVRLRNAEGGTNFDGFDSWLGDDVFEISPGNLHSGTARLTITLPRYIAPGIYTLTYTLRDYHSRSNSLSGGSSSFPFGGANSVTVANNGDVDQQKPIITDITLPESVDVTDLAKEIPVSISFMDDVSGIRDASLFIYNPNGEIISHTVLLPEDISAGTETEGTFNFNVTIPAFSDPGEWTIRPAIYDNLQRINLLYPDELQALGLQHSFTVVNRQPAGYLWKGSEAYPDGWREVDWFGWVQDRQTYPYVYHLEHGWIYTDGSDLERFFFYDVILGIWWWVDRDLYPYMYASGRLSGWYYYYAPYGSPGNRWFHDLGQVLDVPESEL